MATLSFPLALATAALEKTQVQLCGADVQQLALIVRHGPEDGVLERRRSASNRAMAFDNPWSPSAFVSNSVRSVPSASLLLRMPARD